MILLIFKKVITVNLSTSCNLVWLRPVLYHRPIEIVLISGDILLIITYIKDFGTHYIKEVNMGALYGHQNKISKESWGRLKDQDINIGLYAGYNGEVTELMRL